MGTMMGMLPCSLVPGMLPCSLVPGMEVEGVVEGSVTPFLEPGRQ